MRMPLTVYCDESGFTGNQLSNRDQRYFAYASVAIEPQRGDELVAQTVRDFKLRWSELKCSRLLKNSPGRNALTWLGR